MDIILSNKINQAIALAKKTQNDLTVAQNTITTLTTHINQMQTKIDELQTQLNNVTPFNASMLEPFAKKVQTFNTDTIYVDSQNSKAYKMYAVNNVLALEEIPLPQNI